MSKEIEGSVKLSRQLRRSRRRKVVTPALVESGSSSSTDSIESEAKTVAGYSSRGYTESDSEVVSLGGFSTLTQVNFGASKGNKEGEREMSKKDTSKDPGRGETPAPGMAELLTLMMEDNKRRDGEMKPGGRKSAGKKGRGWNGN